MEQKIELIKSLTTKSLLHKQHISHLSSEHNINKIPRRKKYRKSPENLTKLTQIDQSLISNLSEVKGRNGKSLHEQLCLIRKQRHRDYCQERSQETNVSLLNETNVSLSEQLAQTRNLRKEKYYQNTALLDINKPYISQPKSPESNETTIENTKSIIVVGDSMLKGINENFICEKSTKNVKIKYFSGEKINDIR
jgi:hypothetical protein